MNERVKGFTISLMDLVLFITDGSVLISKAVCIVLSLVVLPLIFGLVLSRLTPAGTLVAKGPFTFEILEEFNLLSKIPIVGFGSSMSWISIVLGKTSV